MFTTARRSGASTVSPAELLIVALVTLAFLLSFALPARAAESVTVTDLAGRTVSVKKGVARMILGEGRQLYGLAVLDREDPFPPRRRLARRSQGQRSRFMAKV